MHEVLLSELQVADRINWSRAVVDSSTVRALEGGKETGPNPTDKARPGSKHHLIINGSDISLVVILGGANAHDTKELEPLVDAIPPISGKLGYPRGCSKALFAD